MLGSSPRRVLIATSVAACLAIGMVTVVLRAHRARAPHFRSVPAAITKKSPEAQAATMARISGDKLYATRPAEAANAYRQVIQEHKASKDLAAQDEVATAHIRLAYLDSKKEDFEAARKELALVTTGYKGTGSQSSDFGGLKDEAAYESAACLMAENKKVEAKAALIDFLKNYPNSPLVYGAHNRLRMLGDGDPGAEANSLIQADIDKQDADARFEAAVCGPKTLSELLSRLGKPPMDYEKIAKLCGTTEKGTTVEGMRQGLKRLGLESFAFVVNRADFGNLPVPSIWLEGRHYLLLIKVAGDVATVYDPFVGALRAAKLPEASDPDFQASVITLQVPILMENQPQ